MAAKIEGKAWKFGDDVDTDQIIPAERLVSSNLDHLNDFIFEKVRPGFGPTVKKGDVLVAGKNFGCGSSREHAPLSLMEAGFSVIIAETEFEALVLENFPADDDGPLLYHPCDMFFCFI